LEFLRHQIRLLISVFILFFRGLKNQENSGRFDYRLHSEKVQDLLMPNQIKLLICDLDNTLYDWVTFFSRAFYAMVDAALPILKVERERLLDDLQEIHRRYYNTEHPFALLETRLVMEKFPDRNSYELYEIFSVAFSAFNTEQDRSLALYPGVKETLLQARKNKCQIVGHTEATIVNASMRLSKLGIAPFFDRLYAIEHPDTPHATLHQKPAETVANIRVLSVHERKPDTKVLHEICETSRIVPSQALYVGDSISRDIGMANAAGTHSAWAKYGTVYDKSDWERLVRVTHWSPEDVLRTKKATSFFGTAEPEVTLEQSMTELLEHFQFGENI
jgi:phosphoglycolate phosphatase